MLLFWLQSVSVNKALFIPCPLLYVVPQDSVLGPILLVSFCTYHVFTVVNTHSLSHCRYVSGPTSELFSLVLSTLSCISQLNYWMNVNKVKLNGDKTEMILIKPPPPPPPPFPQFHLVLAFVSWSQRLLSHHIFLCLQVLVSHWTSPSHSANMLLMSAVSAT